MICGSVETLLQRLRPCWENRHEHKGIKWRVKCIFVLLYKAIRCLYFVMVMVPYPKGTAAGLEKSSEMVDGDNLSMCSHVWGTAKYNRALAEKRCKWKTVWLRDANWWVIGKGWIVTSFFSHYVRTGKQKGVLHTVSCWLVAIYVLYVLEIHVAENGAGEIPKGEAYWTGLVQAIWKRLETWREC